MPRSRRLVTPQRCRKATEGLNRPSINTHTSIAVAVSMSPVPPCVEFTFELLKSLGEFRSNNQVKCGSEMRSREEQRQGKGRLSNSPPKKEGRRTGDDSVFSLSLSRLECHVVVEWRVHIHLPFNGNAEINGQHCSGVGGGSGGQRHSV